MNKSKIIKAMNTKVGAVAAVGILGAGAIWYTKKKTGEALEVVGDAINPISQNNIFNRGVNAIVQNLTGNENQTLGGWIYDITHEESDGG